MRFTIRHLHKETKVKDTRNCGRKREKFRSDGFHKMIADCS